MLGVGGSPADALGAHRWTELVFGRHTDTMSAWSGLDSSGRRIPTVIVARHVRPGREAEFAEWMEHMQTSVERQPGFLHADFQSPDDLHPDEWVVTFQFSDGHSLNEWMESDERRVLMAAAESLIIGDPRQQILAVDRPVGTRPVTAVISSRVKPGLMDKYRAVHAEIGAVMRTTEGFLRSELFEAVDGLQTDTVVVFSFDSRVHLDAWLHSGTRQALIARFDPLIDGPRHLNVVGGFAGWFTTVDAHTVKRWKQTIAVLCGLFPTALVIAIVRARVAPHLPLLPAVFVGNVIGSIAMSYVVMPRVTRVLSSWLAR
jgi:uncharacterized protein